MPLRKIRARNSSVTSQEVESLRRAITDGYPWLLHTQNNVHRRTGLSLRLNILLSYVTGIVAGAGVFLDEEHPSQETIANIKAELQADIDEAEERFKNTFTGKRRSDSFFRHMRTEY
jgi:hypothetical protein